MGIPEELEHLGASSKERFASRKRIRSFAQFLEHFHENPYLYLRNSPQYLIDMMDSFGTEEVDRVGKTDQRFKLFDLEFDRPFDGLVGQERVQNAVYRQLYQFAQRGRADKLILMHGPSGSSKSTTVEAMMRGCEHYSTLPEGSLYRFNWMFPVKNDESGAIGFGITE